MPDHSFPWKSHLALTTVALMYGINYFTIKEVFNQGMDNFAVLSIRMIFCSLVFLIFHSLFIREKIKERWHYFYFFILALFGVGINMMFFLWGLSKTQPINGAVLMITTPVFVFIIAAISRQEKVSLQKVLGLGLAGIGAYLLITDGNKTTFSLDNETMVGDLMIVINATSYAAYLVLVKRMIRIYNIFTIFKWTFTFGAIMLVPFGWNEMLAIEWSTVSTTSYFGLIFLIIGATLMAYGLNAWAMKRVQSSAVGMYVFVQPVFVTIITAIFFTGMISLERMLFILLIFIGVYLVVNQNSILAKLRRD